jgi:hypothetical protein
MPCRIRYWPGYETAAGTFYSSRKIVSLWEVLTPLIRRFLGSLGWGQSNDCAEHFTFLRIEAEHLELPANTPCEIAPALGRQTRSLVVSSLTVAEHRLGLIGQVLYGYNLPEGWTDLMVHDTRPFILVSTRRTENLPAASNSLLGSRL